MSRKYFGTDGVRGKVGEHPITPQFVMHLGYAAGKVLASAEHTKGERPAVLIGKDTRISGYMLESALEAGLSAAGVDIYLCGPMPTPAVAYLTRALRLSAGIVISASHNPFEDNGIKFFSAAGDKLPDATEQEIEARLSDPIVTAASAQLGKARRINDAAGRYIEFCKSTFPTDLDLRGLKIVVDCAHGASYHTAPHVFHELGADVVAIGNQPDGLNINLDCGAQAAGPDQGGGGARRGSRAGTGRRRRPSLMCDASGTLRRRSVALRDRPPRCRRGGRAAWGTLMTTSARASVPRSRCLRARAVGDRYVLELLERGWQLGGENSGHIICLDKHTTGDGIVSALQVLHALRAKRRPLGELLAGLRLYPQVLVNVRAERSADFRKNPLVQDAVRAAEAALTGRGRVLLRPSGTEPVIRVMVEGESADEVQDLAQAIAEAIRQQAAA
jgi:phosphoglucosamine mutase